MAKRGENIYKRKDGRYEGRYVLGKREDGRTRFGYVYGYQLSEVRQLLLRRKAALLEAKTDRGLGILPTLRDWSASWLMERRADGLKPTTVQTYVGILERYILPDLGDLRLNAILPDALHDLLAELGGRGLSQNTVQGAFRLLSNVLRGAVEAGMLRGNPCARIRLRAARRKEQRVLSLEEQRSLLAEARERRDLPSLLSLYTGMRLGEVCALRWRDVDWQRRTICVWGTAQRTRGEAAGGRTELRVGAPKTEGSARTIPVPAFLMEELAALGRASEGRTFIFGGEKPAEPRTLQRHFGKLAERAGLRDVHFHTLRHSFATRMMELGVDIKTISRLLGHSAVQTTLEIYTHSLLESQQRAIERLEAALNEPSRAVSLR